MDLFACPKNLALWSMKIPINCMLFDALNAGNRIFELLDFNFFLQGMPPDPLGERGRKAPSVVTAAYYTFSGPGYN